MDGLRGLAILLVVTGHLFSKYYIFNLGWTGLNLFFLLSGYLITNRLFFHISSETLDYFKNFYARRILRIFPLYYGCLITLFVALPLIYNKYQQYFSSLYNIQEWYWFYISNWRIILYGLPSNNLFFHFWSLAVEEQFYLIWPLIFFFVSAYHKRILTIFIILILSFFFRAFFSESPVVYYNTLTAAEPLLLGCLVSILEKKNKLISFYRSAGVLAVLSVISLCLILLFNADPHITNHTLLGLGYLNIDLIWTFLLIIILTRPRKMVFVDKTFSSGLFVWLGIYSYGIYIFHWIILQLFINKYDILLTQNGFSELYSYWLTRTLGIVITLIASFLSYHLYEQKFLSLKKYFI